MNRTPLIGEPGYLESRGKARILSRLARSWKAAWTPRVPPDPVEWVEGGGVILPGAIAARGVGGRLSFKTRPYWRLPLQWFAEDGVEVIAIEVAAQCGKTTLGAAIMLYAGEWLPGPQLYLMPSEEQAEDFVRDRLRPIFQASPFGRGLNVGDLRLGGVSFPSGGNLNVIGVGSPNALKARPVRVLCFDEYNEAIKKNVALGSPFDRAMTRTRTYGTMRRVVVMSTPTKEDEGITPLVAKGKRYEWHCPCPHCGVFQKLELGQVRWPRNSDGTASEESSKISTENLAWYECSYCGGKWDESQRLKAISDGQPFCLDPEKPNKIKCLPEISVLYSPDVRISEVAEAFLNALADPESMKQFQNEWMARPTSAVVKSSSTDQAHLAAKGFAGYEMPAPDWWRGHGTPRAPDWVRAVTWGFDVQGSEAWGMAVGWGDHRESIILWSGKFAGTTDLDDAAVAFRRTWIVQGGEEVHPIRGMMDSGYRSHEVYRVCSRTPALLASKGRQDGTLPMSMSQVDRQDGNRRTVGRVDLAILWTTYWQDIVAAGLEQDPGRGRGATHLPLNPPAELYRHLCAERKKRVRRANGSVVEAWVAHDSQNHLRDCLVYATAAAGHAKRLDMVPRRREAVEVDVVVDDQTDGPAPERPAKPAGGRTSVLARIAAARTGQARSLGDMRLG